MSNLIQDSIRDGSLVLYHDYRAGHALDLSGNGNDGTLGGADARLCRNGFCNDYYGAGYVSVPHSASINLTTFTVVALIIGKRITQGNTGARVFAKGPAGSRAFDVNENNPANAFGFTVDGGTSGTWFVAGPSSVYGYNCLGFSVDSGNTSSLYIDGSFDSTAGPNPVLTTNALPLYIGNLQGLSRGFGRTISSFLMWNRLLSATEHRQAYLELLK